MHLLLLIKWRASTESCVNELRIVRDAAFCWERIGGLLALSSAELAGIRKKHNNGDPEECISDVFHKWLTNGGQLPNAASYPLTWKGLYCVLCNGDLYQLAQQLSEALEAPWSSFKGNL